MSKENVALYNEFPKICPYLPFLEHNCWRKDGVSVDVPKKGLMHLVKEKKRGARSASHLMLLADRSACDISVFSFSA